MKLSRSRRFTVKMGDYESYSFGAEYELGDEDFGGGHPTFDELHAEVIKGLEAALLAEVQEAAELTQNQKSFIIRALEGGTRGQEKDSNRARSEPGAPAAPTRRRRR